MTAKPKCCASAWPQAVGSLPSMPTDRATTALSTSFTIRKSTMESTDSGTGAAGATFSTTRPPAALTRSMTAQFARSGTSI